MFHLISILTMFSKFFFYIFFFLNFISLKAENVEEFLQNKYAPTGDVAFFVIGKSGGYWRGFIVVNPENWEIGGVQGWTYLNK